MVVQSPFFFCVIAFIGPKKFVLLVNSIINLSIDYKKWKENRFEVF